MSIMYLPYSYYIPLRPLIAFHPFLHYPVIIRQLPEVNPNQFIQSAQHSLSILVDAQIILNKIANSKEFSRNLMNAAQESKTQEVDKLIKSIGTKNIPKIAYNPDGITFNFDHKHSPPHCCYISFQLRWS
jgi:DNA-directed RNA polymerase beta' subunit